MWRSINALSFKWMKLETFASFDKKNAPHFVTITLHRKSKGHLSIRISRIYDTYIYICRQNLIVFVDRKFLNDCIKTYKAIGNIWGKNDFFSVPMHGKKPQLLPIFCLLGKHPILVRRSDNQWHNSYIL